MVVRFISLRGLSFCVGFLLLGFCACQTPATRPITEENMIPPVLTLSPGDTLDITFPGATNLTAVRRVGPEGAITMPLVGSVQAGGKTVGELETELEQKYQKELNDNDVIVALVASANVVYVTGQVGRPGRVQLDRPLTALEAILEVGGFLPEANMKKVLVTRWEGNENIPWVLNLEPLYSGAPVSPFYLKPRDSIYVPKKVQWF
jgi:protein involved in polysaccharide export with SLBB domain